MNTLHLSYAVEVARCGSITQAAENLYMAQPNLSKAIRELEETMGFPIFARTARGVVPTPRGEEFLVYAQAMLTQLRKMEALSGQSSRQKQQISLAAPGNESLAACVAQLIASLGSEQPLDLLIREAGPLQALSEVAEGRCTLGIACYPEEQEQIFQRAVKEKSLKSQLLAQQEAVLLMSVHHPLAERKRITRADLSGSAEIQTAAWAPPRAPSGGAEERRLRVEGRQQQLAMLRTLPETYLWSLPEPPDPLRSLGLIQRHCSEGAPRFTEALILPAGFRPGPMEQRLIDLLAEERQKWENVF